MMRPRLCWLRRSCAILFALQLILTAPLVAAESEAPPEYPNHRQLRVWRDAAGEYPVETPADWAKRRAHILLGMQQAMGKLPDRTQLAPLDVKVTDELKGPGFTRYTLSFAAEANDRVPCYLYPPANLKGKLEPAMFAQPQTTVT